MRTFSSTGKHWTCTFEVTITATEMSWSPKCPPKEAPIWRGYRRWRDRCLQDFGRRTGVVHRIQVDIPQAGLRGRFTCTTSREAAYRHAKACYEEIAQTEIRNDPQCDVREQLLKDFGAVMLSTAPNGGMQ